MHKRSLPFPRDAAIRSFQRRLLLWYRTHCRALAWRKTVDSYEILVAEVMLQQTQVERVKEKWPAFLRRFPSVRALARASRRDVLQEWRGMGYNRRALNLRRAAQEMVAHHGGVVPRDWSMLQALPGVGDYTASAVRVFAFNECDVAVDVNVKRVLGRHLFRGTVPAPRFLRENAARIVPKDRARDFHNALMDFGSLVCAETTGSCGLWGCRPLRRGKRVRRVELLYRGVPRRIWRGKVIDVLRDAVGGTRIADLADALFGKPSRSDTAFLTALMSVLEGEGMVVVDAGGIRLPE